VAQTLAPALGWVSAVLGLILLGVAVTKAMVPRTAGTGIHDPVALMIPAFGLIILGVWIIR
jgi:hypothetical protein